MLAPDDGTRRVRRDHVGECYVYNPVATVAAVKGTIRLIDSIKRQTNGELLINLHLG